MNNGNCEFLNVIKQLSQDDLGKLIDFAIQLKKEELRESTLVDY